jgi:hypothetical protein
MLRLPRSSRALTWLSPARDGAGMGLSTKLPRLQRPSGELLHLDLMRFVAAAGIVFHHSHEFFVPATKSPFLIREQREGLALFVDLFFLISGFVIAYLYHNRMNSLVDYVKFLQSRIGRLLPLHWLTLLLSITMWSTLCCSVTPKIRRHSRQGALPRRRFFSIHFCLAEDLSMASRGP